MTGNSCEWQEKFTGYDYKWQAMAGNGLKWLEMTGNV